MFVRNLVTCAVFVFIHFSWGQSRYTIKGILPQLPQKEIMLKGFDGLKDTLLFTANTDSNGQVNLQYPGTYTGAALLQVKESASVILLLHKEDFSFHWEDINTLDSLTFENSPENTAFAQGIRIHGESEGKLAGLKYLLPLYEGDLKKHKEFQKEIDFQEMLFPDFLKAMPEEMYAGYYLKIRKLLQDMPLTANRYIERMPEHEIDFNHLDFSDERLLHSGLYRNLLEGYFMLLESYGSEEMYSHINPSTDAVLKSLKETPGLLSETAGFLFKFFEKRSLYPAAEHLALSMLSEDACELGDKDRHLYEQYRTMAIGNTAPDIAFIPAIGEKQKLSDIRAAYKLVVFGASWCPECQKELPRLKQFYIEYKERGVEVVWISLDTVKEDFERFANDIPFLVHCDYKGWEGKAVEDFHVFATPTMYLLDDKGEILLKPISVEQLRAWMRIRTELK